MKLRSRLAWSMLLAVSAGAFTAGVISYRRAAARLEERLVLDLEREAHLVAAALSSRPGSIDLAASRLGVLVGRRVTIMDETGVVLGDSDFDAAAIRLLDNHSDRPEVRQALREGTGADRRVSTATNRDEIRVAIAAWPGVVRVSAPATELAGSTSPIFVPTLLGILVGGVVGLVFSLGIARQIGRPLSALTDGLTETGAGHVPRLPDSRVPEVRAALLAFRVMAERLGKRIDALAGEREQTRAVIDGTVEGIVAASERGTIVHLNPAAREYLGLDVGHDVPNLSELFYEKEARAVVDSVRAGGTEPGREVQLRGRRVLMTARPLRDGGAVLGLLDVTEARKVQAVRRDFVANVSHELKTPLTSILGYAETLLEGGVAPDVTHEFLGIIRQNARRMQRIVEDLLDLARVESGAWAPQPETLDLATVVREAWSALGDRPDEAEVDLVITVPDGFVLSADREALQHILTNLFDNAIRHTPPHGKVTVSGEETADRTVVVVADTGSGIPAEHVPRIFERFYRVDPGRSRDEGGTGLGLSIVRHLVEVHGGEITLRSAVGGGTSVRMAFPHPQAAAA